MKKLFALLLCVGMMLTVFAACGESSDGTDDLIGLKPATSETSGSDLVSDTASGSVASSDTGSSDTGSSDVSGGTGEFALGTVKDLVWENSYIGLGFRGESGLVYANETELQQMVGLVSESGILADKEALKNAAVLYDCYAIDQAKQISFNVILQKGLTIGLKDEDILQQGLESLQGAINGSVTGEIADLTVGGKTVKGLDLTLVANGVTVYEYQFIVKCGGHLAAITVGAASKSELNEMLSSFYWL